MSTEYIPLEEAARLIDTTPEVVMEYFKHGHLEARMKDGVLMVAESGEHGLHNVDYLLGEKRLDAKFQILQCPFCGGKMIWNSIGDLSCVRCNCEVLVFASNRQVDWPWQDRVVEHWNTRVSKEWSPEESALRQCPCCGHSAKLQIDFTCNSVRVGCDTDVIVVEVEFDDENEEDTLENAIQEAIRNWNSRAGDQPQPKQRRDMRRARQTGS